MPHFCVLGDLITNTALKAVSTKPFTDTDSSAKLLYSKLSTTEHNYLHKQPNRFINFSILKAVSANIFVSTDFWTKMFYPKLSTAE